MSALVLCALRVKRGMEREFRGRGPLSALLGHHERPENPEESILVDGSSLMLPVLLAIGFHQPEQKLSSYFFVNA